MYASNNLCLGEMVQYAEKMVRITQVEVAGDIPATSRARDESYVIPDLAIQRHSGATWHI